MSRKAEVRARLRELPANVETPFTNPLNGGIDQDPTDDTQVTTTVAAVDPKAVRVRNRALGLSEITRFEKDRAEKQAAVTKQRSSTVCIPDSDGIHAPLNTRFGEVGVLPGDLSERSRSPHDSSGDDTTSSSDGGHVVGGISSFAAAAAAAAATGSDDSHAGDDPDCAYGMVRYVEAAEDDIDRPTADVECAAAEKAPIFTIYPGLRVQTWWIDAPDTNEYPARMDAACSEAEISTPREHSKVAPSTSRATNRSWRLRLIFYENVMMMECLGGQRTCAAFYEDVVDIVIRYTGMTKIKVARWLTRAIARHRSIYFPAAPIPTFDDLFPQHSLRPETGTNESRKWASRHRRIFPVTLFPFLYIFMQKIHVGVTATLAERDAAQSLDEDADGGSGAAGPPPGEEDSGAGAAAPSGDGDKKDSGDSSSREIDVGPRVKTYVKDSFPWVTTGTDVETVPFMGRLHHLAVALCVGFAARGTGWDRTWREMVHAQLIANISIAFTFNMGDCQYVIGKMAGMLDSTEGNMRALRRSAASTKREAKLRVQKAKRQAAEAQQDVAKAQASLARALIKTPLKRRRVG